MKNNNTYFYRLEKYHGPQSRSTCPNCGRKRCFTNYVDPDGNILHESVGRCNHESGCGYHYTPRQFFADHPNTVSTIIHNTRSIQAKKEPSNKPDKECFIPMEYVDRSVRHDCDSGIISYLRKFIAGSVIDQIIDEYKLGVTHAGDVIYFEIDKNLKCHTGKIMKYDAETGHRIKDEKNPNRINWVHSRMKYDKVLPHDWELKQCLFGEHLLTKYPEKVVALVEAEKTAIICSAFMPQYIWLATGGKSQLNDRVRVLTGRKVFAFPDLDALDEWRKRAAQYPEVNIQVSSILHQCATPAAVEQKMDIADWVIEWAQQKDNNQ